MSTEILGQKYETPIIIDPTGGHKAYHPDGEEGVARAAKIGDHLMILSTQASTSVADVIAARGRPIWSQLYATNKFEVAKHHVESMERQGSIAVAVTVDRNGGRNQEIALRMRAARHAAMLGLPRQFQPCGLDARRSDVRGRRSVRAQEHPVVGHVVGLHQAAARPDQDEDGASRASWPGRMQRSPPRPASTRSSSPTTAAAPTNPAARPSRRLAGNHSGLGQHAGADRFRLPPRHRHRQGAVHGRQGRRRRPALSVGPRRLRPAGRRARAANPAHRADGRHAAGRRAVAQGPQAVHGGAAERKRS